MFTSRKEDYVRIKKLVKEELNGHLKENLIAGSIELFKASALKAQSNHIPPTKQVQKEQMKVSIAKQQGKRQGRVTGSIQASFKGRGGGGEQSTN